MSKMNSVYGQGKDNYMFKIRLKSTILVIWFILLTIICLLPIYILVINATRSSHDIALGFSLAPGDFFSKNIDRCTGKYRRI